MFSYLRRKRLPFEDMGDVKRLVLTADQYNFFVERLEWGIERGIEDGGVISVYREGDDTRINRIYTFPDEFKSEEHVHMEEIYKSEWYESFLSELSSRGERLGYYYHTHPFMLCMGCESHEERKTGGSTWIHGKEEFFDDRQVAERRMGDIIVERVVNRDVSLYGFTLAHEPYFDTVTDELGRRKRMTHSLVISVPELGLEFDSRIHHRIKIPFQDPSSSGSP